MENDMNAAMFIRKLESDNVYETRYLYKLHGSVSLPVVEGDSEKAWYANHIIITTYHGNDGLRAWATPSDDNGNEIEAYELASTEPDINPSTILGKMGYILVEHFNTLGSEGVGYSLDSPYWEGTLLNPQDLLKSPELIEKYGLVLIKFEDDVYTYGVATYNTGEYDVYHDYTDSICEQWLRYKKGLSLDEALDTIIGWTIRNED
jgi:hypothetical protein